MGGLLPGIAHLRYHRQMDNLVNSFNALKKTARSVDDIAMWFKQNLSIFPDLPEHPARDVRVTVNDGTTNYRGDPQPFISEQIDIYIKMYAPANSELLTQVVGKKPKLEQHTCLYEKTVSLELPAHEWPYMMADALWDYHSGSGHPRYFPKKQALAAWLPQAIPGFSWEAYESLLAADLLPQNYQEFTDWVLNHIPTVAPSDALPSSDFI